jgi:hypothetical protein
MPDRRIGAVDGGAGCVVGCVQMVLICTVADLIELGPVTAAGRRLRVSLVMCDVPRARAG